MVRLTKHIAFALCLNFATAANAGLAEQCMARGRAAFETGALDDAAKHWQQAAQLFAAEKNSPAEVEALVKLGLAYQSLGQYRLSVTTIDHAVAVAQRSRDPASLLLAKSYAGMTGTCGPDLEAAERNLRESLVLCRMGGPSKAGSCIPCQRVKTRAIRAAFRP